MLSLRAITQGAPSGLTFRAHHQGSDSGQSLILGLSLKVGFSFRFQPQGIVEAQVSASRQGLVLGLSLRVEFRLQPQPPGRVQSWGSTSGQSSCLGLSPKAEFSLNAQPQGYTHSSVSGFTFKPQGSVSGFSHHQKQTSTDLEVVGQPGQEVSTDEFVLGQLAHVLALGDGLEQVGSVPWKFLEIQDNEIQQKSGWVRLKCMIGQTYFVLYRHTDSCVAPSMDLYQARVFEETKENIFWLKQATTVQWQLS